MIYRYIGSEEYQDTLDGYAVHLVDRLEKAIKRQDYLGAGALRLVITEMGSLRTRLNTKGSTLAQIIRRARRRGTLYAAALEEMREALGD